MITDLTVTLKWPQELKGKDFIPLNNFYNDYKYNLTLKESIKLPSSLVHLQRQIELQYQKLPWPTLIKRVAVLTETPGGLGDIAAAAKAITVMQKSCPHLLFNWFVLSKKKEMASEFLKCPDPSKVNLNPLEDTHELLILGPDKCGYDTKWIEKRFLGRIDGPRFCFLEAGTKPSRSEFIHSCEDAREIKDQCEISLSIFKQIFSTRCYAEDGICMGLLPGSGIFFDESRLNASLSRGYCCPKPLLQMEDTSLQQDILFALQADIGEPNYDLHSFNSGYAHRKASWGKFIDFVAIHEREKNVTIVLNQTGSFSSVTTNGFVEKIFYLNRIHMLQKWGYGNIKVKGKENDWFVVCESSDQNLRSLTVIIRPYFKQDDMKNLQLASERLLATGMNTPAESWAAKCKLYLYEDVNNFGVTDRFLKQQIKVANHINPQLGKLLAIVGENNKPLSDTKMEEATKILLDPELSQATLSFCQHVVTHYRFNDAFEGSLKRIIWHHYLPNLAQIELDSFDENFKKGLFNHLKSFDNPDQVLSIATLQNLANGVQAAVQKYFT